MSGADRVGNPIGGMGGHWVGGKAFGEGSDGQKLSALGCSLIGGLVSAWGRYFDIHAAHKIWRQCDRI